MFILDCEISHLRLPVLSHLPSKFIFPAALLHDEVNSSTRVMVRAQPSPATGVQARGKPFFLALAGYFPASAEK